nr:amino acid permease [Gemmatimonadota bacterium]
ASNVSPQPGEAAPGDAPRSRSGLLRILGVWDGLAVVIGVIIGSGILRTPGIIAANLGEPLAIFGIWVLGALVAIASALVLAELVTLIPRVGGKYVYAREAFGPVAGFVTGWSEIVSRGLTAAAKAVVIGEYVALLTGVATARVVGALVPLAFAAVHWAGLRPARALQNASTVLKVLVLLGVTLVAFLLGDGWDWEPPVTTTAATAGWLAAFALSFQVISFTYYGYDEATKLAEEVRHPQRDMPRILIFGILAVAAIYLLVNAGYLYVLTPAEMAGSPLVAADVVERLLGREAEVLVTLAALVVLLGSINVNFLSLPRVGLALAQDGLAPRAMSRVSRGGTPRGALLVATVVVLLATIPGSFLQLVMFIMFVALTVDGLVILGLFRLRRTRAGWERPFRVPLYPGLPLLVLLIYAGLLAAIAVSFPSVAGWALLLLGGLWGVGTLWARRTRAVE